MRSLILVATICVTAVAQAAETNPCTNGSFEQLNARGFPVHWAPVGTTVEVSTDAHLGRRALRLLRTDQTPTPETGLNRGYRPDTGRRGAMLEQRRGGIDFWYKAISTHAAQLNIYAIPMTAEGVERTASPRATFTIPPQHIGDGRWHHARLKYDFTKDPKVRWVHFAARIVGTAGEVLLDDFAYLEHVGPLLQFGTVRLEEDAHSPGRRATVEVEITNAGDAPARGGRAMLVGPPGLEVAPAQRTLADLAPDARVKATWTLKGRRAEPASLDLTATAGGSKAIASLRLAPRLSIRSFGPVAPVALAGRPITLECELENAGNALVLKPRVEFSTPAGTVTVAAEELAPGGTVVLEHQFTPPHETPHAQVSAAAQADNVEAKPAAASTLVVGADVTLPVPSGRLAAEVTPAYAVLEDEHIRLVLRRNAFGFGPAELTARTADGWKTVAWMPRLGRLVDRDAGGARRAREVYAADPPRVEGGDGAGLRFSWSAPGPDGATWKLEVAFRLAAGEKSIQVDHRLGCDRPCQLLALEGPMLYALTRDEAVFPGLEWLVDDEISSGTLDIVQGHEHQVRYVVHPNMVTIPAIGVHGRAGTVGLVWDVHQKWDGQQDRPSVVFASPDRFENQRAHLMGLFLPTVPQYVEPNEREAARPYSVQPERPLRLTCRLLADANENADVLAAVDEWIRLFGLPQPAPLPHGSYDGEIAFSMRAYLDSLWDPQIQQWWTTKGAGVLSHQGRPRAFVADLLLGEVVAPSEKVRRACRGRAEEVLALIGGPPRIDFQRQPGRTDLAMARLGPAANLLASRDADGTWRFDADMTRGVPFVGKDYHELGPDNAVEVGTCARNAFEVLRYARVAGDRQTYERMVKTLQRMETFRVPRAAQVWEVPVHTPDVLAAADAVDAFLEAYRLSGDQRWLDDAVAWARRGLPFIYLWDDPEKPFLLGASIPVFGATWYRGSWFGRPVQWNGLRYANALLTLAEYDQSYPWRRIAETVIRSAVWQQNPKDPDVALWPDNISALDAKKAAWLFAPRQILRNILKLTGRDEDPATVILGQGETRVHVSTVGKITTAALHDDVLGFKVRYPRGQQGVVLVANVGRPRRVLLDGQPVAERAELETASQPGWRYDPGNAFLSVRVDREGPATVRVEGVEVRRVDRLPQPVDRISFEFDDSAEGWMASSQVDRLNVQAGSLRGTITGADPYLVRGLMHAAGDDSPVVHIRMWITAGGGGQFFWTTKASPQFGEDKMVGFPLAAGGEFSEFRLQLGHNPRWAGETITAIRIDPGGGAASGEFAIDYVRGDKR